MSSPRGGRRYLPTTRPTGGEHLPHTGHSTRENPQPAWDGQQTQTGTSREREPTRKREHGKMLDMTGHSGTPIKATGRCRHATLSLAEGRRRVVGCCREARPLTPGCGVTVWPLRTQQADDDHTPALCSRDLARDMKLVPTQTSARMLTAAL